MHNDWISSLSLQNSRILTGSFDGSCNLFDSNGTPLSMYKSTASPIKSIEWISPTLFVAGAQDASLTAFRSLENDDSTDNKNEVFSCVGHTESIDCLAVNSSRSHFASAGWDKTIRIWTTGLEYLKMNIVQQKKIKSKGRGRKKRQIDESETTNTGSGMTEQRTKGLIIIN